MLEEVLIPVLGIVFTFGWLIIWVYMFYSTRSRVKLALIESGRTAAIFRSRTDRENALKFGLLAVMAGIGILFGEILKRMGLDAEVAYFSMILIMGGIGLLTFYVYINKKQGVKEREYEREDELI